MKHETHKHQIHNRLYVGGRSEILVVSTGKSRSNTMVGVHHTSNSIESVSIKLILLRPEPQVAQQEPQYFVGAVIEQPTIPKLVTTLAAFMEVEVISPVKFIQAVQDIFAGVRMNDVKKDR